MSDDEESRFCFKFIAIAALAMGFRALGVSISDADEFDDLLAANGAMVILSPSMLLLVSESESEVDDESSLTSGFFKMDLGMTGELQHPS